jgi:NAD(P)H-hydrate epimerase
MKAITREQMIQLESLTTGQYAISSTILMENAGRMSAQAIVKFMRQRGLDLKATKILVVCGTGNNGGDGAVAARHLFNRGFNVEVLIMRDLHGIFSDRSEEDKVSDMKKRKEKNKAGQENLSRAVLGDAGMNFKALKAFEVPVKTLKQDQLLPQYFQGVGLIVDSLLGTGLDTMTSTIKSPMKEVIQLINELEVPVISLDVPSGLDCNTGALAGIAVHADCTVTFGLAKVGLFRSMGPQVSGEIEVVDISLPRLLLAKTRDAREEAGED